MTFALSTFFASGAGLAATPLARKVPAQASAQAQDRHSWLLRPDVFRRLSSGGRRMARALNGMGRKAEARLYFERVLSEYPKSQYTDRAKRKLDQLKA